jgi:sugar phosphate isomerase/epimerase
MEQFHARIALQLYTVRDACEEDLPGTLQAIADQGYNAVELYTLHGETPAAWRALLDQVGLDACSRHVSLDQLEAEPQRLVNEAHTLGMSRLVVPTMPRPATVEEADAQVARLTRVAAEVVGSGLPLGYHNHAWELEPLDGSVTTFDRLVAVDSDLLFLELDLGWAWQAGADPAALLRRHAGRCPLVHVKDQSARDAPSVPVGTGAVPYREVIDAARATGVEWLIVEQEHFDASGSVAAAARSLEGLRGLLGPGRPA